jgi:hypothetical protein
MNSTMQSESNWQLEPSNSTSTIELVERGVIKAPGV